MKKILIIGLFICNSLFANSGNFIEVINENIIKIEENGKNTRLHLAGLNIFANADFNTKKVSYKTKEELKKKAIAYMQNLLKNEKTIKYHVVGITQSGIKKVWLVNKELNYKLVRDGYALVQKDDINIPSMLKMRMNKAMHYAKNKKLGLWGDNNLVSILDLNKSSRMSKKVVTLADTKREILQKHINALPKSSRTLLNTKIVASK